MSKNVFWGISSLQADADRPVPTLLLIGDSWFWYPIDNLAVEVGGRLPGQVLLAVGRTGADAGEWATKYRKDIERAFDWHGNGVSGLMLSGGGNDIAGMNDFLRLIKDDCSAATTVADCYRPGQPDATLAGIDGAYRAVIAKFRACSATAPVFVHQYDYAWPTGRGVFGPATWLKAPMDAAKVPPRLRRPLFKNLIDQLKALQVAMAANADLRVVVMETAGVLPDDTSMWANELHPTPAGFRRLAKLAVLPALKSQGIE